jgi:SAM-dependent methyltransferase
MHEELIDFFLYVRSRVPDFFVDGVEVLDVGSGDVNGTNRPFFDNTCVYKGNDAFPGRNVDLVYKTTELPYYSPSFDVIISSECFQHDPEWKESLQKIVQILRPGGLFLFSCATTGRPEHGTKKHEPVKSFATRGRLSKFMNHYHPLTFQDLYSAISLDKVFLNYGCFKNTKSHDLYFWGIKAGGRRKFPIPDYAPGPTVQLVARRALDGQLMLAPNAVTVTTAPTTNDLKQQQQQPQQRTLPLPLPLPLPLSLPNQSVGATEPAKLRAVLPSAPANEIVPTPPIKQSAAEQISPPDLNKSLTLDELPTNERELVLQFLKQMGKVTE